MGFQAACFNRQVPSGRFTSAKMSRQKDFFITRGYEKADKA
jgi:hypothetical protein